MVYLIEQLTSAIRLITEYPRGLSMLLGTVPPPGCEEINEMLETVRPPSGQVLDPAGNPIRISGGEDFIEADARIDGAEMFDRIIGRAGGWAHINESVAGWKEHHPRKWAIFADYVIWVNGTVKNIDGSQLKRVADKHGVGHNTVSKVAQEFPQYLATAILYSTGKEEFRLEDVNALEGVKK
jgi:hypothetical protein